MEMKKQMKYLNKKSKTARVLKMHLQKNCLSKKKKNIILIMKKIYKKRIYFKKIQLILEIRVLK